MPVYDDDIFVEGKFKSSIKNDKDTDVLSGYNEGDIISTIYIPVKEITYKDETGFGVYVCETTDDIDAPPTFILSGTFSDHLDLGQTYESNGTIKIHEGKKQVSADSINKVFPKNKHGIISFMNSLDGMRFQSHLIYDKYGNDSLNMIKEAPEKIVDLLKGIDPYIVKSWKKQIDECRNDYGYLSDLIKLGIKPAQAKKIYDEYGDSSMQKITNDPYFLIGKIQGYGFKKCDEIAKNLGHKPDEFERLSNGVKYYIKQLMAGGSTCFDVSKVIMTCSDQLSIRMTYQEMYDAVKSKKSTYTYMYGSTKYKIPTSKIQSDIEEYNKAAQFRKPLFRTTVHLISESEIASVLNALIASNDIVIENGKIELKKYSDEEYNIAYYLRLIKSYSKSVKNVDVASMIDKHCKENGYNLEERQREAVLNVASTIGGTTIINGAAGCGKTFCIKIALKILEDVYRQNNRSFSKVIIAPTGKASRVAHKATGIDAFTIHRLLQYSPSKGFYYNSKNKLPYDCIVIDECSMLDTSLTQHLFSAISPDTKVIMMGDTNQLPSVGAGNILYDFISSGLIDVVTLNVIKRQGVDSGIVTNARNIINGDMVTTQKEQMDSLVIAAETDNEYVNKIKKYCDKILVNNDIGSIQLLSPMRRGITGTNHLNYLMQSWYNNNDSGNKVFKQRFEVEIDGQKRNIDLFFKVGDKVINTKNDYQKPWYILRNGSLYEEGEHTGVTNGEVGFIVAIDEERDEYGEVERRIVVEFEDKYIVYSNEFENLEHAYAMTIHRSQGSEWQSVILVLNQEHKSMLNKNLFYTGITRSKQFCVVISDKSTLEYSVKNNKANERTTGLIEKLRSSLNHEIQLSNTILLDD